MTKYYEVRGETEKKLKELFVKMKDARERMYAFAKRHGADVIGLSTSFGVDFVLGFKSYPDLKIWKLSKGSKEYYRPRLSSKEGKALNEEMRGLSREFPSGSQVAELIGMNWFKGSSWQTPGMFQCDVGPSRIILEVPDDYNPPPKLRTDLFRVSDVKAEALIKEK